MSGAARRPKSVDDLRPAPYNPRDIGPEALAALKRSIHSFGDISGLTWNERTGHLVTGHQRLRALREEHGDSLHLRRVRGDVVLEAGERRFKVRIVDWDDATERAANMAANSPLLAGVFTEGAGELLEEMSRADPVLFCDLRLDELLDQLGGGEEAAEPDPNDAAPELPAEPVTQRGDLWRLGGHLLVCGDATEMADAGAVLGGRKADVVFTDPPYNMAYKSARLGGIANDDLTDEDFARLLLSAAHVFISSLRAGGSYYVCMGAEHFATVIVQLRKLGMGGRPIVWAKRSLGLGSQEYRPQFEMILYGYTGRRSERTWNGQRRESDLWDFDVDRGVIAREEGERTVLEVGHGLAPTRIVLDQVGLSGRCISEDLEVSDLWRFPRSSGVYVHPTQKPVALVQRALRNSSHRGDLVLESFAGSGTTLVAAELLGRRCGAIELDPGYCDVVVERWQDLTGGKAERKRR